MGLVGVWLPRAELGRRIDARFAAMRAAGLEAEVRALAVRRAVTTNRSTIRCNGARTVPDRGQAIGYKEVLAHLDGENPTLEEAFDLAIRRTRQFARRQRVWFRRDPRIRWIGTARNPDDLAAGCTGTLEQLRDRRGRTRMTTLHLAKLQATGNDFLVRLALDPATPAARARNRRLRSATAIAASAPTA